MKIRGGGYNAVTSVCAFHGNAVAKAAPSSAFDRTLCGLSGVSGASPDKRFGENDIPNHSLPTDRVKRTFEIRFTFDTLSVRPLPVFEVVSVNQILAVKSGVFSANAFGKVILKRFQNTANL